MKSQIYFLSLMGLCLFTSCTQQEWYKKEFSEETMKTYASQLRSGAFYSNYQGTVAEQMHQKEALSMDSTNAALWRELGTARVKRGILDEMEYYYAEAVKRHPEKWAGFRGYLYLYFYRNFPKAIADFNLGDEVNGQVDYSQGQSHDYMRGICYYGLKDYQAANEALSKYIDKVTQEEGEEWVDVYAILYKGLTLMKLDRINDAITEFDRALKYYPNLSDCFYHKARIYVIRGQFDLALMQLDLAEKHFKKGYFHQRPYVEVLEQIYLQDIQDLRSQISTI
ncbi:tetratricopeptide repeat protein [Ekhidna sp.]|uniref:tetratricopeptide repeat protein n=1 Tax=Ekhidna sp. TaxID=2608089 RepID=UPI003BABE502